MRIYYCECGGKSKDTKGMLQCNKCEKLFGVSGKISDYINMRNTLAHTTKIEFSESTVEDSVKKMNANK